MTKYLFIEADTNDADYINTKTKISTIENDYPKGTMELIRKVTLLISKQTANYNWPTQDIGYPLDVYGDLLTEEEVDLFDEFTPFTEHGIHTITEIKILEIEELEVLL